ncbi:MAG TPA: glutamate-5-semialdehyde dehydrogenase [Clostridiales bacterium]|jgi:glutamate-5-semialdehyde dehydrogenase|nr:glutamate-5-semialdehyde dehydrogenase [Clostridiales bacterium]
MTVRELAQSAKKASGKLAITSSKTRNDALLAMADALIVAVPEILKANDKDVRLAKERGVKASFIDRLTLDQKRVENMANGMRKVALLADPIGKSDSVAVRPNGLRIEKRRVPLGVIGIIYEARPNVTADAIALCLKSSNACVLRGGSEALNSNAAVCDALNDAAVKSGIPDGAIQLLRDTDRAAASEMMKLNGLIDVLIPRGGAGLIQSVVQQATIPVIETGSGVCHVYIDETGDLAMAADIIENAKCSRPSVCNAAETLLVHEKIAADCLPQIAQRLSDRGVELRCDARAKALMPGAIDATKEDWATEYNDLILSVRVVDSFDEAVTHIETYGTHHSDSIITSRYDAAERFLSEVDSAAVYVNASTRFTDGEEFGFGAEIGISTQKLHARGPMGLDELTTVKYVIRGAGQIR